MSERNPIFLTSRKFRKALDQRDAARAELAEMTDLLPFLGLAREIKSRVDDDLTHTVDGQVIIRDRAVEIAKENERARLIEEYAQQKRIELTEEQRLQLRDEFIRSEQNRIDKEVMSEVAKEEERHRAQVARTTEAELRKLKREELLERIGTDEAQETLRRFGELSLRKIQNEALIAELKAKAEVTHCVNIADLPVDSVINVGLDHTKSQSGRSLSSCNRILTLRVINTADAMVEVMDDSWMSNTDQVRRENALEDLTLLLLPQEESGHNRARFSKGVEPMFLTTDEAQIDLYGLEVQCVSIGNEVIFN